jgi:hypothetical protein
MVFLILGLLFIGVFFLAFLCIELRKDRLKTDKKTQDLNLALLEQKSQLEREIKYYKGISEEEKAKLRELQEDTQNTLNSQKELAEEAFQNWWSLLEKDYQEKEKEYNSLVQNLKVSYAQEQERLNTEAGVLRKDLDKIRATRDAAVAAQIKEKEIKEKFSFYCLPVSDRDLEDIKKLEKVKNELHSPRILSMLIWSTYFQKPMNALCNNILGTTIVTGIYKITNQTTGECYIGQGLDLARRWKDHAKCGLGIDPPAANKLYKAMQADGIWNFSWELLEECPQNELNEKEKFYINLYQSYNFGYNSNSGIGK